MQVSMALTVQWIVFIMPSTKKRGSVVSGDARDSALSHLASTVTPEEVDLIQRYCASGDVLLDARAIDVIMRWHNTVNRALLWTVTGHNRGEIPCATPGASTNKQQSFYEYKVPTPLHWAALTNSSWLVSHLVTRHKADIHARTSDGADTPVHLAARHDKLSAFGALYELGANCMTVRNGAGEMVFDIVDRANPTKVLVISRGVHLGARECRGRGGGL
ncbi:hypothetical protein VTK26DRAFT_3711 [Humicola hyalothermophila]